MASPNYDDPKVEEKWCDERLAEVAEYLQDEGIIHAVLAKGLHGMSPHMSRFGPLRAKYPQNAWAGGLSAATSRPITYRLIPSSILGKQCGP